MRLELWGTNADRGEHEPKDEDVTDDITDPDEPQDEGSADPVMLRKGFGAADLPVTPPPLDLGFGREVRETAAALAGLGTWQPPTLGLASGLTEFTRNLSVLDESARQIRALTASLDSVIRPALWVGGQLKHRTALDGIARGLLELASVHDTVRRSLDPFFQNYKAQWQSIFETLAEMVRRAFPANLREAEATLAELEPLLLDEGIPLMWVPRAATVSALLDAPDAGTRRRIIGQRWRGIITDCEAVLDNVTHPDLRDDRGFARDVASALKAGHTNAAQALAANLLDSILQHHLDDALRVQLTKNDFKTKGVKFKMDDHLFMTACTFAPVWYAHAKYFPKNNDRIPRTFGRHPSVHGVSRTQYSRINAVYALMLVTSVIKYLDGELL
ncbi:hypothetical protein ACFYNO_32655 [Kitasatospora sp. NPDC006697]|uniref:hypothetical protein n=1 Tax=Kitasatospora sp. NPDC006697 TaxID=3364020 RepID=UPI00368AAAA4